MSVPLFKGMHKYICTLTLLPRNQSFYRQITSQEKDGAASGEDGNRVQDSCNRLNSGALDAWSSAPQLSLLQLQHAWHVLFVTHMHALTHTHTHAHTHTHTG